MVQVVPMHPRRSRFVRPVVILLLGGMFTASDLCADATLSVAEIAAAVAFLASPDAAYITGINIPVDGGRTPNL